LIKLISTVLHIIERFCHQTEDLGSEQESNVFQQKNGSSLVYEKSKLIGFSKREVIGKKP